MKELTLYRSQVVAKPLDEVFAFFADAHNLTTITPPWLRFNIATHGPITMSAGATIDYTIKLHGFPMRWQSKITIWEPPRRFVDEQRKGPYRSWIHEHRFDAVDNDSTRIHDTVRYSVMGGALVNKLLVKPDLDRIFDYRARKLVEILDRKQAANK